MESVERIPQLTRLVFDNTSLDITFDGHIYSVELNDQAYQVEVWDQDNGRFDLLVDGRHLLAHASSAGTTRWITVNGRTHSLIRSSGAKRSGVQREHSSDLSAPMPGLVRSVNVSAGDHVAKGQILLVLEAMKMEIRLNAPFDGVVLSITSKPGQTVEREQILVKMQRG